MKYKATLLLLIFGINLNAQEVIEPCKFGNPLIEAVQASYSPTGTLGYGPARDILYSEIDNNGLELSGIYTNFTVTLEAGEDPSQSAFSNGINAEHVYPQSLGASNEPMKSDLHNIFPSKVNVNESRGNCKFNEINDSDTDKWFYLDSQLSSTPSTDIDFYSEKDDNDCFFEPRESVKGDIARAMFYFYTIYKTTADAIDSDFFSSQKDILYQWHLDDPVDMVEHRRDSLIALEQGNNNPFIVDSTLAFRAYFVADAVYPEGDPNCYGATTTTTTVQEAEWVSIPSNFVDQELNIFTEKTQGNISIFDLQGRQLISTEFMQNTSVNVQSLNTGLYIIFVKSEESKAVMRFYKM